MPIDPQAIADAMALQHQAARDPHATVRLVAGPGTGKSAAIEERFRWLYADSATNPAGVFGVSFTRAAAKDLRQRVHEYCRGRAVDVDLNAIQVSTLHSLALSILARAHRLNNYPVRPVVMDDWEVENLFDAEFAGTTGWMPSRCDDIRKAHEAFWSTGQLNPANYLQPDPPISGDERTSFLAFHTSATQSYAAVLPGELIRHCVEQMVAGLLPAAELVGMRHLVVDEYQDLNPMDLMFIDELRQQGVSLFVAGDDDQSIYSFRYASPGGIQDFTTRHVATGDHILEGRFRCAVSVVQAADTLIARFWV